MNKKKQFTLKEIANALVQEGIQRTTTGKWSVSFQEIRERFGIDLSADSDAGRLMLIALKQEEEVNELIMTEDHIEMSYHLEYCPACNQGGSSGMGSVFSLLGCNIYDDHLHQNDKDVPMGTEDMLGESEQVLSGIADFAMR